MEDEPGCPPDERAPSMQRPARMLPGPPGTPTPPQRHIDLPPELRNRTWPSALLALALFTRLLSPSAPGQSQDPALPADHGLSEPGVRDQYLVRQWTTQQGLPQNTVTCLEQTPDGYLWMGTRYGLVRHDGLRMSVFLAELDDVATDAVDVRQLVSDPDGTLWILTRRGLYANRNNRFARVQPSLPGSPESLRVECLARARDGGLWLGGPSGLVLLTNGVVRPALDRVRGFRAESITEILEDRQGRVWLQTVQGLHRVWIRWDRTTGRTEGLREVLGGRWAEPDPLRPYTWESVHESRDGRLWVVSSRDIVCLEDGREVLRVPAGEWAGLSVRRVREDGEGNLWIVTEGELSLHRFDGRTLLPMQQVGTSTLASDLRALLVDREGNLWLGSGNAGVYRLQPRPLLARRPRENLSRDEVFSIVPRPGGGAWLGTLRGLLRLGPEGTAVFDSQNTESGVRCKPVLLDRRGKVWTGVFGGGLATLEGTVVRRANLKSPQGSPHWQVRCLFEDAGGGVWAGTDVGLLRWSPQGPEWITRSNGLTADVVLALAQTPDGALWAGTDGGGLNRLRDGRWRAFHRADGLLHDRVWPLTVESDGTLWLGTPLGLNRIRGDRIDAVTPRQGLTEDLAYSLIDDGRGWYWSHGNHGLCRVRRDQLNAVADGREPHVFCVAYDESDGMESTEGNGDEQPSAARLANGELWFPTTRGVVVVDPARLRDPATRPLTVVERMVANGRELLGRDQPLVLATGDPTTAPARLRVQPELRGLLEFHYTSPSFVDAERMRFRYRLAGWEDAWNEPGTRRVAYYTGLTPGNYRFEVLAGNRFGLWSEHPAVLEVVVEPRFRETWGFRLLVAAAAASALFILHRRRIRFRRKLEELNRHQALDAERTRIARDLHDELGAGLAAVAMKVEFAHGLAQEGREIRPILDQVGQASRDLVSRVREAVWTLNPSCDSLENVASFIAEWVEDFVEHAHLNCRIELPPVMPALPMSAELRHGLVMSVKEAVSNAVRHARATEIRLALRLENNAHELVIDITDDGAGFAVPEEPGPTPASGARGGSGLGNLRQRMASLHGRCDMVSNPGLGTRITLRLPVHLPPSPS